MAIWDVIGNLAEWTDWDGWGFTNSSYGSVIGDYVYFTMGGGYTTNILGTNCTLVIDWESLLEHALHLGPLTSGKGILGGLLFGIGGDTSMVVGNRNTFSYMGDDFTAVRGRHAIECKYDSGDLTTLGLDGLELSVYNAPVYAVLLGCLALFTGALVLQLKYKLGLGDGDSGSETEKLAVSLIPALETRWLWVVKALEFYGSTLIPLNARLNNALTTAQAENSAMASQVRDIQAKVEAAELQVKAITLEIKTTTTMMVAYPADVAILQRRVTNAKNQLEKAAENLKNLTESKAELEAQYAKTSGNVISAKMNKAAGSGALGFKP
jgi:hypothetical protein